MREFVSEDLRVEISFNQDAMVLSWQGKSRIQNPEELLIPFLERAWSIAAESRRQVSLRFEALEFCNSSTLTAIMRFFKRLRENDLQVTASFDARRRWQRLFAEALTMFVSRDGRFRLELVP
jgi:hypothetical protein